MVKKPSTTVGKIKPYVDVRNPKDIPKFESLISTGPITIVLVYADWCGHCKKLKGEMWDSLANSPNKGVNTAAVHYDMLDKTSIKGAPLEGYPTIFEVKATPQANIPTPIPTPQSKKEMEDVLNFNKNVEEMNISNNVPSDRLRTIPPTGYMPESLPPNISDDTIQNKDALTTVVESQKGGSLFESLLKIAADSAHAVVLAGSAAEIAQRVKKRRTKKAKRAGKKKSRKH